MASNKEVIRNWVAAFNKAHVERITSFYHDCAINHQVVDPPVEGKVKIQKMFEKEFANAEMVYIWKISSKISNGSFSNGKTRWT